MKYRTASFCSLALCLAALVLTGVQTARASYGDMWTVTSSSQRNQDVWRVDKNGVLRGGPACGGFDTQKVDSQTVSTVNSTLNAFGAEYIDVKAAASTIYLPDALTCPGKPFHVKADATSSTVLIQPRAGQTIDGSATATLTNLAHATYISDGVGWRVW